ncbi:MULTISPECIES: serine hydrolase [Streptomyces]|uniref:serine hydrolase n=1 Tax=Streptomyces TaxID=1883 RepID=UPI0013193665|nr:MULTISPECIES: serine hydrolase [Streptomyces]QGZ49334.1 serine hydrolase [Streptomyces sp. QHH-9511]GGU14024.1 serine hydrolase [Streptomyces lateritius]
MTAPSSPGAVRTRITAAFTDAGITGQLHAVDIDTGASHGIDADTLVPTASVHKLCLIATLYRQAALGRLDLRQPLDIPAEGRSPGATGLAAMRDAARLSLRDLATLAVAVSDNTAADLLFDTLGLDTVNQCMADLGLTRTVARHTMRELYATLREDSGGTPAALTDPAVVARLRALDPARTNHSTPREITGLLTAAWRDDICPGEHGQEYAEELRTVLGLQAWSHRLAAGFPFDDVRVSGKTGSLPTLRHEAGVVEYPDGGRYAVAVFTRAAATTVTLPAADAAIGRAARIAVDALRA